jgi:hypothetical protein
MEGMFAPRAERSDRTPSITIAALALLSACVVGCTRFSSGGGASGLPFASFADQYCSLIEPCCAREGLSTTGVGCRDLLVQRGGYSTYDGTIGGPCLAALQATQGAPDFCVTLGGVPPECLGLFGDGTPDGQPPGQPCHANKDCARAPGGEALCTSNDPNNAGVCVQTFFGMAGDGPCIGEDSGSITTGFSWSGPSPLLSGPVYLCDQSSGLTCDQQTKTCLGPYEVGDACDGNRDCVSTAYCDLSLTCASRAEVGAACEGPDDGCVPSAYCNHFVCAARLPIGAACTDGQVPCDSLGFCDPSTQICTPLLGAGAACSDNTWCLSTYCANGTCTASGFESNVVMTCG